jgi:hypothetical protein
LKLLSGYYSFTGVMPSTKAKSKKDIFRRGRNWKVQKRTLNAYGKTVGISGETGKSKVKIRTQIAPPLSAENLAKMAGNYR